jgi:hypothetical protein
MGGLPDRAIEEMNMPCLDCLEKRAKVLNAMGLGRFAPDLQKARAEAGVVAPVAIIEPEVAATEFDLPPHILEQFHRYLEASDNSNMATITHASVALIGFILANACTERKCAEEQISMVCETLKHGLLRRYDPQSGKRREVLIAKAVPM